MVLCKEDQERLLRIRAYISEHLDEDISQEKLASLFFLSISTLRRHFSCCYGITVHEHILKERMSRAQNSMDAGDTSLADLAQSVGYRDTDAFCLAFARYYGQDPRERYPGLS